MPAHPVWFWLILAAPFLSYPALWIISNGFKVSLKPLTPWLVAGVALSCIPYLLLGATDSHKGLSFAFGAIFFYSCSLTLGLIQRRYMFEALRAPGARWYAPWRSARFSIPANTRILVQHIDAVLPWYVGKLGLRKLIFDRDEPGIATLRVKEDGNSFVLTTRSGFQTGKTPILFAKKIGRVRDVMAARGVNVGIIERDRQGIRYFQIHDPEGNEIEVVEDR